MEEWILNIILGSVFFAFLVLLSVLILVIWNSSNGHGFDHRILFALYIFFQGAFVLLSSFDLPLVGQKLQHIFTQGLANVFLISITVLFLLEKKYLITSFIAGTLFIIEIAFIMISTTVQDLELLTSIISTVTSLFFILSLFFMTYLGKQIQTYFRTIPAIIGISFISCSNGIRQVLIELEYYWGALLLLMVGATFLFLSIVYYQQKRDEKHTLSLRVSMTAILAAIGVVLSFLNPFGYFTIGVFKINPFAHLINAIAGVFLGPLWAVIVATFIAIIRYSTGIGSIFAFPGGIPGAFVVGIIALVFTSIKKDKYRYIAAFFEPIGTVGIGAVISVLFMDVPVHLHAFMWAVFAASSILGSVLGWLILWALQKRNINYLNFGDNVIV